MPDKYPIMIRGQTDKLVKIYANNYGEAVAKAIDKYRNKFINYKHAKAMDLISARVEAAEKSRKSRTTQYIVMKDDEFELSTSQPSDPSKLYGIFTNGAEDKEGLKTLSVPVSQKVDKMVKVIPAQSAKANKLIAQKTKQEDVMAKKAVKTAKKAAKKVAAKKKKVQQLNCGTKG